MENLLLKEIAKSIEIISEKTEKIDNQTKVINTQLLENALQQFYTTIVDSNKVHEKRVKAHIESQQRLKVYFDGFKNGFPLLTKQHLVIKGVLKFHIYLYTLFICILITTSIYVLNNFKDSNNYQKAWIELMELNHSKGNAKILNDILKRNSN